MNLKEVKEVVISSYRVQQNQKKLQKNLTKQLPFYYFVDSLKSMVLAEKVLEKENKKSL